jgi:hypothetical protein
MAPKNNVNFSVPRACFEPAYAQVKESFGRISKAMMETTTLAECLVAWGFQLEESDQALTVTGLNGDGIGLDLFCGTIASFVTPGGYLELEDDDGVVVKITFSNGDCEIDVQL